MKKILVLNLLLIGLMTMNAASAQALGKNETQGKDEMKQDMDYSGKGIKEIPFEVFSMTDLKQLDISNNNFTALTKEIKNLKSLSVLKLNGNKIYELPVQIQRLKFLREIYLDREIWQYRLNEVKKLTQARIILMD